jgi:hypothetical protein
LTFCSPLCFGGICFFVLALDMEDNTKNAHKSQVWNIFSLSTRYCTHITGSISTSLVHNEVAVSVVG